MFNCHTHGWTHHLYMCPVCCSKVVITSNSSAPGETGGFTKEQAENHNKAIKGFFKPPGQFGRSPREWTVMICKDHDGETDQISSWDLEEFPNDPRIKVREVLE